MMNFNAMESTLRQRVSHGQEFTVNYSYGRAMTNSLGNYGLQVNGYSGAFQNYYHSGADYGPAGYDIKHNISATAVYAIPLRPWITVLLSDEPRAGRGRWWMETVDGSDQLLGLPGDADGRQHQLQQLRQRAC